MPSWVVLMGSPRKNGRSAKAAREFARWVADEHPEVEQTTFEVPNMNVAPCTGCNMCNNDFTCIKDDEGNAALEAIVAAERLFVFTPIYFAGVPGPFKGMLDRFQPLFWKRMAAKKAGEPLPEKRRAAVVLFGEGNDPHGYEPAVVTLRSALALADFAIEEVQPCIGRSAKPNYAALAGE